MGLQMIGFETSPRSVVYALSDWPVQSPFLGPFSMAVRDAKSNQDLKDKLNIVY